CEALLLLDSLGPKVLRGDHADPHGVPDIAEDHRRSTTNQHHVVPGSHLEDDGLDVGRVALLALAEPVPERWLLLGGVRQLAHALAERFGRLRDDPPIRELPSQRCRQHPPDFRAPLPTVSDMATMLIAHLLVNTRTPPRATDVANEGVADDTREPVPPPCGTPHHSDDSPADLSAPILS